MRKLKLLLATCALLGGAFSANAQTDVTSTYITNADFEGEYSSYLKPKSDRDIYQPTGWTITYSNGDENDLTSLNSSCTQWSNFSSRQQPISGGSNTYWIRYRWGNSSKITLSQTATLTAGVYRVSADAFVIGSNATATISAAGKSVTIDTRNAWANYGFVFTLTESTSVTFAFNYNQSAQDECIAGVDNFKLFNITQGASDITGQDWTSMIANAGFELGSPTSGNGNIHTPYGFSMEYTVENWKDGNIVTNDKSEGEKAYNLWAGTTTSLDIYQTLQLPVGKYTITADMKTPTAEITDQGVYAKIGDDIYKSATLDNSDWTTLSKDFYVSAEGSVQLGASSTGGANSKGWFKIDNFTLTYKGAIQNTGSSITSEVATAITNDKWYTVDISADGEYKIISSVDNTVKYTQDGYKIPSDISTSVTLTAGEKQVVNLTRGTLYVQASTDATLTVAPNVYSYSVGDATPSVADNGYTQSNTMTFTFADASTNDPDGALSILDDSKIKVNDVAASASIDGKVLTITLASTLATSTDYAVSIEAGAVGYNVDNANDAISLTAKTPAVFDGTYFIATTDGKQFISRGGDSNTEAALDEYGIAVNFITDANNVTHIQFVDNDKNLFGGSSSIYTDKNESDLGNNAARARWTVASVSDGYTLYCGTWSKYIKAGTGAESGVAAATYDDNPYTWVLEAPAAHQTMMAALKDANAAAVANAAGLTNVTSVDALETELDNNWNSSNVTLSNSYQSVTEKYQPNGYSETIINEQSLTGLKNGIYKIKLSAFHRIRDYAATYTLYQNGADNPTSYLYANSQKVQLPSPLTESNDNAYSDQDSELGGKHYPNGMVSAGEAFTAGKYTVEVYAVVNDGTLKIGLKDPGKYSNANWICFRDLAVTAYTFNGDYSELETAIATAEGNLGFEAGEYAPYNNLVSMGKLASAKALYASQDAINQSAIDEAKTALTSATWTSANAEEVNAIYDGDFDAAKDNVATNTLPTGWHGSDNHYSDGYWCRYVYSDGSSNAGLTHFTNGSAMMSKSTPRYGLDDGYTMPLKANTYYTISFDFAGWNSQLVTTVVITDGEGEQVTVTPSQTATSANAGQTNTGDWKSYTGVFKTNAAGNYVLKFDKKEYDGNGGQVAYGAIKLFKASSANMKITDAQWATFCAPFDVEIPEGVTAYTVDAASGDELSTTEVNTTIPANKPVLLYSENEVDETFYGKTVESENITNGLLTGVYTATEATVGKYVLMNDEDNGLGFYIVESGEEPTIGANRAYLTVPGSSRAAFFFDGKSTGLNDVRAKMSEVKGDIYNLNGQRVTTPKRGLYIVNGKKVVVK